MKVGAIKIKVTIIQPNINPWDKWNEIDTSNQIKINADLSIKSLKSENGIVLMGRNCNSVSIKTSNIQG